MKKFDELLNLLAGGTTGLFIQTHDFPDHDAVATAFGLQKLLEKSGFNAPIVYEGGLTRDSLVRMIRECGIEVRRPGDAGIREDDRIIVVDGCTGNRNMTDIVGREIAVIDHHLNGCAPTSEFADIPSNYGACATIVYEYYLEAGVPVETEVATARMIGLNIDTALLTRGAIQNDVDAYANLFRVANVPLAYSILLNNIEMADLKYYDYALHRAKIDGRTAFCYYPDGCSQNLLGILGDFYLSLKEIDLTVFCAKNGGSVNVSVRSEIKDVPASKLVARLLEGIGFGGGHAHMAGGIVPDAAKFDETKVIEKIKTLSGGDL
jgi:nanoRNase/pAp phosphatase (c-di-AMP/oligoRNAs hydrolase)